jgi:DNA modification methylase
VLNRELPRQEAKGTMEQMNATTVLAPEPECRSVHRQIGGIEYSLYRADCLQWMNLQPENRVHAIVTDPPFGLKEYSPSEKKKLRSRHGGIWRIPPSYDGCQRSPVPRFTVLTAADRAQLRAFFVSFAARAFRILVPGGHLFIASSPLLSHLVYLPLMDAGFEKRGEVIRLVQTLRGGDRPKNAHQEFPGVTVMPRSCWEPWGLFRKPCDGRVQDNLRKWKTGGLRRLSADAPFADVIVSSPTRSAERRVAPHPSLKPQAFMQQIVRASLPLGVGIILDPFMGAGSTIAAAIAVGYRSIGIESDPAFFNVAIKGIPALSALSVNGTTRVDAKWDSWAERLPTVQSEGPDVREFCRTNLRSNDYSGFVPEGRRGGV